MSRPLVCVAIAVPGELGTQVDALRARLQPERTHMPAHITLLPPARYDDAESVRAALGAACAATPPFDVRVGGVGAFGDRVAYLRVDAAPIESLQAALAEAAGIEAHEFTPHVTVAHRCAPEVSAAAAQEATSVDGEFRAHEVTWFEHHGVGWEDVHVMPLGRQPAPAVTAALESLGLEYRVIVHTEPVRSLEEAAAARGVEVADVVKTLVVRRGDDDYVLVLVPGGRSLSWPPLRELLGVSRLSMPPADEAKAATGFERGTITPLGTLRPWPVIADMRIAERGEVTLGSGERDVAIGVDAAALLAAIGATVADVTVPEHGVAEVTPAIAARGE